TIAPTPPHFARRRPCSGLTAAAVLPCEFMVVSSAPPVFAWTPDSWRARPALQQPEYPDTAALDRVLGELRQLPPLVTSWEIVRLREQLAEAVAGKRFVLQGGDCAERLEIGRAHV